MILDAQSVTLRRGIRRGKMVLIVRCAGVVVGWVGRAGRRGWEGVVTTMPPIPAPSQSAAVAHVLAAARNTLGDSP